MPGRTFFEFKQISAAVRRWPRADLSGRRRLSASRSWTAMRIAEVIGTVTLSRVPSDADRLPLDHRRAVQPEGLAKQDGRADGEDLVILDELGAGNGSQIGVSEGAEAADAVSSGRRNRWMRTVRASWIECATAITERGLLRTDQRGQ